jgi:hypothetical protein
MPATINDRDRQKVNQSEVLAQYNQIELPKAEEDLRQEAANARRMFDLPSEFFSLSTIVVCSIWPEALDSQTFTHGGIGRKVYHIEAGSVEKPAYMILQNTFDMIIQQIGQEKGSYPATIPAAAYGNDIIRYWTGDHPANTRGKKGIGIIKGQINAKNQIEATPQEIHELERLQNGYLDYLIERADNFWDRGDRDKIGVQHKRALALRNQDITLHPWFRSRVQMFNECPNCAEPIKSDAIFCKVCSQNVVDYFIKYNEVPDAAKWPRVYKLYERMTATANANANKK